MTSVSQLASSTTERPGAGAGEWAGRQTPWSNEAEQAVLGAMVLEQDAAPKTAAILDATNFYHGGHRPLFRARISLPGRGHGIAHATIRGQPHLLTRPDLAGG